MNESQENNSTVVPGSLGVWLKSLKEFGPLEAVRQEVGNHSKRFSVSVPPELGEAVTQRARALKLNRSHYIRLLISADIGKEI